MFWVVFPFLVPQALYVRKSAPRFAPADGPTQGSVGDGCEVRLLAVGDSIIAGVGASELSKALVGQTAAALAASRNCCVAWRALGVSGFDSNRVLEQLVPELEGGAFDYIIVSVGVNDITGLTSIRAWRRNLALLLRDLRAHSPGAVIAVAGMPPLHGFPLLPQPLRAAFGLRGKVFDDIAKKVIDEHPAFSGVRAAQFAVRVRITDIHPNCPRNVHKMAFVEQSNYTPKCEADDFGKAPWGDDFADVLPEDMKPEGMR